jgi:hypothetical protein
MEISGKFQFPDTLQLTPPLRPQEFVQFEQSLKCLGIYLPDPFKALITLSVMSCLGLT